MILKQSSTKQTSKVGCIIFLILLSYFWHSISIAVSCPEETTLPHNGNMNLPHQLHYTSKYAAVIWNMCSSCPAKEAVLQKAKTSASL